MVITDGDQIGKAALIEIDDEVVDDPEVDMIDEIHEAIAEQTRDYLPGSVYFDSVKYWIEGDAIWIAEPRIVNGKGVYSNRPATESELLAMRIDLSPTKAKHLAHFSLSLGPFASNVVWQASCGSR